MANWTEEEKWKIWDKGDIVPGYDKNIWKKDQCGAFIKWDCYGDRSSQTNCGWGNIKALNYLKGFWYQLILYPKGTRYSDRSSFARLLTNGMQELPVMVFFEMVFFKYRCHN